MKRNLSVVVARLVLFLRNQESYKEVLSSRGTDAQQLLDLLQDVSTSRLKPYIEMLILTKYTVARSRGLFGCEAVNI
jgi:hypothetical protein